MPKSVSLLLLTIYIIKNKKVAYSINHLKKKKKKKKKKNVEKKKKKFFF